MECERSSDRGWKMFGLVGGFVLAIAGSAAAQLPTQEEDRLRILTDPEAVKKKLDEKRDKPPFEFFKSQIAPFDILPYVKANHWSTLSLDMRANDEDYEGLLRSDPVPLEGTAIDVVYRRDARLLKDQRRWLAEQVLLPNVPKQWTVSIARPGSLRADAPWQVPLTEMSPHQALVLILSKDATTRFATWNRMAAMIPSATERDNPQTIDRERYYRVVLPVEIEKMPLSSHPLTWTTFSHVIWDGLPPDTLTVGQQQAMLYWLHWGGQLILIGGAGHSYALDKEGFLGPYLPGEPTGESVPLGEAELDPLSKTYPPPTVGFLPYSEDYATIQRAANGPDLNRTYQRPVPIRPADRKPVYLAALRPAAGASTISLGEGSPHLLAVERRVGRGRITMLTINPTEPTFAHWPGLDTMVRRVILRRPDDPVLNAGQLVNAYTEVHRGRLTGRNVSWYRITSRDARVGEDTGGHVSQAPWTAPQEAARASEAPPPNVGPYRDPSRPYEPGVADWRDNARFPALARDLLEESSGIRIPSSGFVLRVIFAYLIVVVPLNWLVCRFVFNRREWAWFVVPVVALAFAIGVQRGAAYDLGFDSASDELDLLEVQGDYPRAHLSRFASIYSSGRGDYTISYPDNNTALALPLGTGRTIAGEDRTTTVWDSSPVPALSNLIIQPRTLSLFRAEEMTTLAGAIRIEGEGPARKVVNGSELELRDAILIDINGTDRAAWDERYLGTIAPGGSVEIGAVGGSKPPEKMDAGDGPDLDAFLRVVRSTWEPSPENAGEIRLVAWVARSMPGQVIDPPLDRVRGRTAVLVHLRSGPPPSPDSNLYFASETINDQSPEGRSMRTMRDAFKAQLRPQANPPKN